MRWRVDLAGKATRTVEARGFRVEFGALVLVQPAGCAAWLSYKAITEQGPPLGLTIVCAYFSSMIESHSLFGILRQSADADCVTAIERLVADASDHQLSRINVLAFASRHGLDEEKAIASFLHAARSGLFELSWNVLCPGCGGVLDACATLKSVHAEEYHCALCGAGYAPT